jgi:hypothetical protein
MHRNTAAAVVFSIFAYSSDSIAADWRPLPLIHNGQVSPDWQHIGWGKMVVEGDAIRKAASESDITVEKE